MTDDLRRELTGYAVWGSMGLVIAVPELSAAVDSEHVRWPTISGTVGYLEYWHPWVALVVVGLIVWAVLRGIRFPPSQVEELKDHADANPSRELKRTPYGRLTIAKQRKEIPGKLYFPLALAIVIGGTVLAYVDRPDDKYRLGEVLYGLIAAFWVGIPSLMAYLPGRDAPFPTLFEAAKSLESRARILVATIAGLLAILLIHLVLYPWPSVIPDLQDLHQQYNKQRHEELKKKLEPPPDAA